MTSRPVISEYGVEVVVLDSTMANLHGATGMGFLYQRLPSEPIGSFVLTLTNVVVGSRIHVEKQSDGTSYYDDVAATSTVSIRLSAYGVGSAYNDLVIKVRKASSGTTYQPWETQATAIVGSQSIYVSQITDE